MPICTRCQADKPDEQFHKCAAKNSGRKSQCKVCRNLSRVQLARRNPGDKKARDKRWDEANPVRRREISLKSYYKTNFKSLNLSESGYLKMFDDQKNRCAICDVEFTGETKACLDHCHTTGKARALLCNCCNAGLGMFRDQEAFLESAIKYLRRFK